MRYEEDSDWRWTYANDDWPRHFKASSNLHYQFNFIMTAMKKAMKAKAMNADAHENRWLRSKLRDVAKIATNAHPAKKKWNFVHLHNLWFHGKLRDIAKIVDNVD